MRRVRAMTARRSSASRLSAPIRARCSSRSASLSQGEAATRQLSGILYLTNPINRGNVWGLPHEQTDKDSGMPEMPDCALLVGFAGRLFRIDSQYAVAEVARKWDAIGTADAVATGALAAQDYLLARARKSKSAAPLTGYDRVMDALTAASHYTHVVRPPFVIARAKK